MSYAVVIPAAGNGTRMGAGVPKVFLRLPESSVGQGSVQQGSVQQGNAEQDDATTIIHKTVCVFAAESACERIVVCVPEQWQAQCQHELAKVQRVSIIAGGATRQESVRLGVEHLAGMCAVALNTPVLVHDGARCCITAEVIARVVQGVADHGAVTAGVRVVDALCRVDETGRISAHVDRESLWAVQTPQGFLLEDLLHAHRDAQRTGVVAADDAALVARLRPVTVVSGDRRNIKVTEPGDLGLVHSRQE